MNTSYPDLPAGLEEQMRRDIEETARLRRVEYDANELVRHQWTLERMGETVGRMRALGVAKLKTADVEIILGPAPAVDHASEPPTEPPTESDARKTYYRRLLGRDVDPKILEQLP